MELFPKQYYNEMLPEINQKIDDDINMNLRNFSTEIEQFIAKVNAGNESNANSVAVVPESLQKEYVRLINKECYRQLEQ